jgi:hypothetical protein
LLASGDAAAARPKFGETLRQARRRGYLAIEFESRLAIAELERKSGNAAAAKAQLSALERDAHGKGFALIARKAAAARA